MELERRAFDLDELEVEERADAKPAIRGHAAVFNQLSQNLGGFRERVRPGAFADSITNDDVRALFNHDANFVLGRNRSGTLTLEEDNVGLRFEVRYPDTQWARDLVMSIKRGDIDQASFAFTVVMDDWAAGDGAELVRELVKVRLYDVSPVTYPAYTQTDVKARAEILTRGMNIVHPQQATAPWRLPLRRRQLEGQAMK